MPQIVLENPESQLARLVEQARAGEEVIILRDSTPIAKIIPLPEGKDQEKEEERKSGYGSGKYALIYMADDFDAPLEDFKAYM